MGEFAKNLGVSRDDANSSTSKGGNTNSSTHSKPKPVKNMDSFFGEIDDNQAKFFDLGMFDNPVTNQEIDGREMFEKVINGEYKYALKDTDQNSYTTKAFRELGESAWDYANKVKNRSFKTDQDIVDSQKKYYDMLEKAFSSIGKRMGDDGKVHDDKVVKKTDMRLSPKGDFNLVSVGKFKELSNDIIVSEVKSNTAKVKSKVSYTGMAFNLIKASIGLNNSAAKYVPDMSVVNIENTTDEKEGYFRIKNREDSLHKSLGVETKAVVSSWYKTALNNVGSEFASDTDRNDNDERLLGITDDMLEFVAKYEKKGSKMQTMAARGIKEMAQLSAEGRLDYIKKYSDQVEEMIDSLGGYATRTIYKANKDSFDDYTYFPGANQAAKEKQMSKMLNSVDKLFNINDQMTEGTHKLRRNVYDKMVTDIEQINGDGSYDFANEAKKDLQYTIHEFLVDANGNLRKFEDVQKDINRKYGSTLESKDSYISTGHGTRKGSGYRRFNSRGLSYGGVVEEMENDITDAPYVFDGHTYNNLKKEYLFLANKFKTDFSKTNVQSAINTTLINETMAYSSTTGVGNGSINMNSADSDKTNNVNKVLEMVDFDIEKDRNDIYIERGGYNQAQEGDRLSQSRVKGDGLNVYKEFFKNQDSELYDMTFLRKTSVPGKSAYVFSKTDDPNDQMTIYIDTKSAKEHGEMFANSTGRSESEFTYQLNGKWNMDYLKQSKNLPTINGVEKFFRNLSIENEVIDDFDNKVFKGEFFNLNTNKWENVERVLGLDSVTGIEDSEDMVRKFIKNYESEIRKNNQ